jgi:hypothetical protein
LDETLSATAVLKDASPRCIDYEDAVPNKCEIRSQLLFEHNGLLVILSGDGDHVTTGEMIEIAKSIIEQKTSE